MSDEGFFNLLDNRPGLTLHRRPQGEFPWSGIPEDREVVHDALTAIYARLGYQRPRFNWARSPYAMFGAMQYLRQMQTQQRQVVVRELMRGGDALEAEVRATFLEGILERDLTVSLGACLSDKLFATRPRFDILSIRQLSEVLNWKFAHKPNGKNPPAGWSNWVFYPLAHQESGFNLQSQSLCMFPFLRCVWICRPPVEVVTDCGTLLEARFEDGFTIVRKPDPEEETPALTDGETLLLPEETE